MGDQPNAKSNVLDTEGILLPLTPEEALEAFRSGYAGSWCSTTAFNALSEDPERLKTIGQAMIDRDAAWKRRYQAAVRKNNLTALKQLIYTRLFVNTDVDTNPSIGVDTNPYALLLKIPPGWDGDWLVEDDHDSDELPSLPEVVLELTLEEHAHLMSEGPSPLSAFRSYIAPDPQRLLKLVDQIVRLDPEWAKGLVIKLATNSDGTLSNSAKDTIEAIWNAWSTIVEADPNWVTKLVTDLSGGSVEKISTAVEAWIEEAWNAWTEGDPICSLPIRSRGFDAGLPAGNANAELRASGLGAWASD